MSSKRKIDSAKARRHLAEQLAKLLPSLMGYIRSNPGLEFSITTGELPFRVVFTWTYKKRRPDNRWQGKIFAKVTELLDGTNLFICPENTGPKGEYILDLRINSYDDLMIKLENDIEVPYFVNVRG